MKTIFKTTGESFIVMTVWLVIDNTDNICLLKKAARKLYKKKLNK